MRATRGQIIDSALQRVGNTTATFIHAARIRLNRILQELYLGFDWPFLWEPENAATIAPSGLVTLPTDFVKAEDTESLMVISTGGQSMASIIHEIDHRTFATHCAGAASATVPRVWTVDYSPPVRGRAWPRPHESCACLLRYKWLPPDLSTSDSVAYDADIPIFPWDTTLTDLLFEWAMSYEIDPRRAEQFQVNVESIARARGASFPERSYPSRVPLDPLVFGTPWSGND